MQRFRKASMLPILLLTLLAFSSISAQITRRSPAERVAKSERALLQKRIRYVFVLYQENRSFDSYFGTFPDAEGLFTHRPQQTPGFYQNILNTNGSISVLHPFRIGPRQYAADTDDIDHSHPGIVAKEDIQHGMPRMDRFALTEEKIHSPRGNPTTKAVQLGQLTMAYEDCDTIPLLWRYASRFVLFDHIFSLMTGPSTPGNLSIIGAQAGVTQWVLHPRQAYSDDGSAKPGVPISNSNDPFWGSQEDPTPQDKKMPVNPRDFIHGKEYGTAINLTFATLPLSTLGMTARQTGNADTQPETDLGDVRNDIQFLTRSGKKPVSFGWYQEGFGNNPAKANYRSGSAGLRAEQTHASYVTHHDGPQYFGYVVNNPKLRSELHDLGDFFSAVQQAKLPNAGGVFFLKGGLQNSLGLRPADPDSSVQKRFLGDDDHPGYSDAQISEALLARAVNAIAASPYWKESVIIIAWDDSAGDYDHVPPPINAYGPDRSVLGDGPRIPLILISPYARTHAIISAAGNHASVVKFVDTVFGLTPLAQLPDEKTARVLGKKLYGQNNLGPQDALTPDVTDLLGAFDMDRLLGRKAPLNKKYVEIPQQLISNLPGKTGYGCKALGIVPTDRKRGMENKIPDNFNPRPATDPTARTSLTSRRNSRF